MISRTLDSITIEGFTSIRSATVDLGRLNVLVGANGAGKSNFVRTFGLLGRIAAGALNLFVNLHGGASALVNSTEGSSRIRLRLDAPPNAYEANLIPAANDELIFEDESVSFHGPGHEQPYRESLGRGQRDPAARGGRTQTRANRRTRCRSAERLPRLPLPRHKRRRAGQATGPDGGQPRLAS
ncbi:AAA family ATPase [Amycolatopsis cihanbeyliensis]|uniref:AAA family ATPase n=1 Tax=Amycolatopsis cihanbeyliensis TaxID=1128664 RepID=UPI001FE27BC8|nr:AAA family ATPase [Amycolatopsis cihanbeyliensis]